MDRQINTTFNLPMAMHGVGSSLTMPSSEIAELCETRHNQVVETIDRLFEKGVLRESRKTTRKVQNPKGGRPLMVYDLTKRDTLVVVAGYNDEVRAKIIDRWMELEESTSNKVMDFSNPTVVLGVIGHLQAQVAEQATRLKTLDRLEAAKGAMCITDAAKTLGVERKFLFDFLSSRRWIFKRAGNKNWLAYDDKRKSMHLEHDDHLYMDNLGQERVATRVLVTAKGLVKLAELLEQPLH